MYRISVTVLEKFRRFMTEASPYDTEDALIESIKGTFLGNDKTKIGGAYHKIIEGDYSFVKASNLFYADDIAFTAEQAAPALKYKADHPLMVHEVPLSKWYEIDKYQILVSGRGDGIEGKQVRDPKTKFRSINVQEYYESYQWRFYLDILNLNIFYYDIFEVKGFQFLYGNSPYFLKDVHIIAQDPFQCIEYDDMHQDCKRLLAEFMGYIEFRDFFHLLKPAQQSATI
jgi:hypothetical protein